MTRSEQAQVEAFAAFIVVRRQLQGARPVSDDIPVGELTALVAASGSFDWLDGDEEDACSPWTMARACNGRVDRPRKRGAHPLPP